MKPMQSKVYLKYNSKEATDKITPDMQSFVFTDNASGTADTISLTLSNRTGKWLHGFYPQAEDYVKAWIKILNWPKEKPNGKLFCGKFQIDSVTMSGYPETMQLQGISVPINKNFNVTQKNRTWKKTNTRQILADIAKDAGIALVYEADSHSIDEISQSGKTDLQFAFSLCSEYGLAMKLYNDKIIAYDQTKYEKKAAAYTIKRSELGGSGAYSFKNQITELYDSVKIQYTGGKKKDTVTYEFTVPGKKGTRRMFISSKAESLKDAELKAKARLRQNIRESKKITLKTTGDVRYKAAENVKLEGFGRADGTYFIERVEHNKGAGAYTCTITAHPVVTEF